MSASEELSSAQTVSMTPTESTITDDDSSEKSPRHSMRKSQSVATLANSHALGPTPPSPLTMKDTGDPSRKQDTHIPSYSFKPPPDLPEEWDDQPGTTRNHALANVRSHSHSQATLKRRTSHHLIGSYSPHSSGSSSVKSSDDSPLLPHSHSSHHSHSGSHSHHGGGGHHSHHGGDRHSHGNRSSSRHSHHVHSSHHHRHGSEHQTLFDGTPAARGTASASGSISHQPIAPSGLSKSTQVPPPDRCWLRLCFDDGIMDAPRGVVAFRVYSFQLDRDLNGSIERICTKEGLGDPNEFELWVEPGGKSPLARDMTLKQLCDSLLLPDAPLQSEDSDPASHIVLLKLRFADSCPAESRKTKKVSHTRRRSSSCSSSPVSSASSSSSSSSSGSSSSGSSASSDEDAERSSSQSHGRSRLARFSDTPGMNTSKKAKLHVDGSKTNSAHSEGRTSPIQSSPVVTVRSRKFVASHDSSTSPHSDVGICKIDAPELVLDATPVPRSLLNSASNKDKEYFVRPTFVSTTSKDDIFVFGCQYVQIPRSGRSLSTATAIVKGSRRADPGLFQLACNNEFHFGIPALIIRSPALLSDKGRPLALWFHGGGEDVSFCMADMKGFATQYRTDVLAVEYGGFGVRRNDRGYERGASVSEVLEELSSVVKHVILAWDGPFVIYGQGSGAFIALRFANNVTTSQTSEFIQFSQRLAGVICDKVRTMDELPALIRRKGHSIRCCVAISSTATEMPVVNAMKTYTSSFKRAFFVGGVGDSSCVFATDACERKPQSWTEVLFAVFDCVSKLNPKQEPPHSPTHMTRSRSSSSFFSIFASGSISGVEPGNEKGGNEVTAFKNWLRTRGVDIWMANKLLVDYGICSISALSEVVSDNPAYKAMALVPRLVYDAKDTVELSRMSWRDIKVFTRLHTAKAIPFEARKNKVALVLPSWCPAGTEAKYLAYTEKREKERRGVIRREKDKRALLASNRVRERRASCVAEFRDGGLLALNFGSKAGALDTSMRRRPSIIAEDFCVSPTAQPNVTVGDNGLRSAHSRSPINRIKSKLKNSSSSVDD